MRLSMREGDPGYKGGAGVGSEIFLDGEIVRQCLTADEEAGFVIVTKYNDAGKITIKNGEIETEIRFGKVLIVLPSQYEYLRKQT